MDKEKELPNRKPTRLQTFDYNTPGAYFVTVCTHNRKCTLSRVVGAIHESPELQLTEYGKIVDRIVNNLPDHLGITVEAYVIMPNHIHLIVMIAEDGDLRAIRESPLRNHSIVSNAVGFIKMNASKEVHSRYGDIKIWQRGFHDHIIRDNNDYQKIFKYICENPINWQYDCFYEKI